MSNLLRTGATWLAGQLTGFAGAEITYIRRGQADLTPTVTPRNREAEVINEDGFATRVKFRELTLTTSDLSGLVPRPGDRWLESDSKIYEVGNVGDMPCFDTLDEAGTMSIIRGKLVKS